MVDKLKTLVLLGIFLFACVIYAEEELSYDEQLKVCAYLNTVRANFTACCEYPGVVMWSWQLIACENECGATNQNYEDEEIACCIRVCAFYTVKVLSSRTEIASLLPDGFIYSFMLSIGNDTVWEPVITGAVNRCYSQYLDETGYDCGIIPLSLYSIISCAYLENYLKCPKWNSHQLNECTYTAEYARKCTSAMEEEHEPSDDGET